MNRRTIRLAAAGGAVAFTMVAAGGTALAATDPYPQPTSIGGGDTPGGPGGTGSGGNGGVGGISGGGSGFTSNGGTVTGGGGASTSGTGSSSGLPFTGFELATALTLGAGAIAAGSTVVVVSRRRRDTSALA